MPPKRKYSSQEPSNNNNNQVQATPQPQNPALMGLLSLATARLNNNNNSLFNNNNNQQNNNNSALFNNAPLFAPQNYYMYGGMPTNNNPLLVPMGPPLATATQEIQKNALLRQLNTENQVLLQLRQSLAQANAGLAQNQALWMIKAAYIQDLTKLLTEKTEIMQQILPTLEAQILAEQPSILAATTHLNLILEANKTLEQQGQPLIATTEMRSLSVTINTWLQKAATRAQLLIDAQNIIQTLNATLAAEPIEYLAEKIPLLTMQISAQEAKIAQLQQQLNTLTTQIQTGNQPQAAALGNTQMAMRK